jgi:lipid-A-disaccharide synthase
VSPLSWALVSRLVKTPFAALPNILAGRAVVPELIQAAAIEAALVAVVQPLLYNSHVAQEQRQAFASIHQALALGFGERCADAIAATLEGRPH